MSPSSSRTEQEAPEADFDVDDEALAKEYDVEGVAEAVFGALDTGGLEDGDEDEELEDMEDLNDDSAIYQRFQTTVHVSAAQRTEANRRKGGRKTQKSIVKSWHKEALESGKLQDDIVDEHALLLFIDFSAGQCKNTVKASTFQILVLEHLRSRRVFWCFAHPTGTRCLGSHTGPQAPCHHWHRSRL